MRKICQELIGRALYLVMAIAVIFLINVAGFMVCGGLVQHNYLVAFLGGFVEVLSVAFAIWAEMFTLAPWRDMVSLKRFRRETTIG